jgi:PAS domain S-box-containing protein
MVGVCDLVDFASDAAFSVDERLRVLAWNSGARKLLGYSAREVVGRGCYDVLQAVLPDGEPLCSPECDGALCFGRGQPFAVPSCLVRHKDGQWIPVSIGTLVPPRGERPPRTGAPVAVMLLRTQDKVFSQRPLDQPLRIFTFGHFSLAAGGCGIAVQRWERKQALTLLKYLVTHLGHPVHRERLIDCLWPEADERQGRERLKVTVYFLRRQLRAIGMHEDVVKTTGKTYTLRREVVWLDAEAFERFVAEGSSLEREHRPDEALRCYEEAQRLYRGDYLEEDPYADWCAEERERLREIYLEMLAGMAECHAERGDYARAAQVCRTALVCEPCRESFHRALMEHLVSLGRTDWAVAQFHRCQRILAQELDVEPMPETQRVYRQIVEGGSAQFRKMAGHRPE